MNENTKQLVHVLTILQLFPNLLIALLIVLLRSFLHVSEIFLTIFFHVIIAWLTLLGSFRLLNRLPSFFIGLIWLDWRRRRWAGLLLHRGLRNNLFNLGLIWL